MAIAERNVPADTDILCEKCGYTLNGLPDTGNCPECGDPIANSLSQDGRTLSEYELDPRPATFWKTTFRVIFDTKRFYRTLKGREDTRAAKRFAFHHRIYAAICFGAAGMLHWVWLLRSGGINLSLDWVAGSFLFYPLVMPATYFSLTGIVRLAEWLTAIEAKFWGIRLPRSVVHRAMRFHSANYLPIGIVTLAYIYSVQRFRYLPDTWYLYGLCALVVLSAGYLFQTYWIGMKNLMYANR